MNLIKPGKYVAKVVEYGVPEVDGDKHPQVVVVFEFEEDGKARRLSYYGSLHPNAVEYTIDNLLVCGLKSDDLSSLLGPGALDFDREVQITIEHHTYNGKTSARIKWINPVGGAKFKNMAPEVASARLSKLNGLVKARRKETGIQKAEEDDFDLSS
jgi:hypothetical protein